MKGVRAKASGYRWVVLAVFMLMTAANQLAWITFAPITGEAAAFYGTSDLVIGLLSLVFMAVYMVMFLPAAWAIDTWGFRPAVGIGAVLTAVGCLGRGLFAENLALVFAAQLAIAVGQPFVLGAITKVAARWFPPGERATASGLGTLSIYLGILGGIMATPLLAHRLGMRGMLMAWGIFAVAAAAAFLALARERPRTPVGAPGEDARALVFDGLRSMLGRKDFILLLAIFFVGLGVFNSVTTWIEAIVRPRGFDSSQAGMAGGLMLIGGIIGAAIVPLVSDALRRRKPFIVLALAGMIPGLVGVTFARSYGLLLASSFAFGFFLLSSGPIGFQYGAEITLPAPEGTSNSLLIVMGQVSGIVFIFAMDALKAADGSMTISLIVLIGLMVASVLLSLFLGESPIAKTDHGKLAAG
ncbi:MAG: MFS transporter [Spirochaetes bacterium]|nr:MFS transporter [Spirochaetota bacterium]